MKKYIFRNLGPGEEARLLAEIHWGIFVPNIAIAAILVAAEVLLASDGGALVMMLTPTLIIAGISLIPKAIKRRVTEIGFTNKNFLVKTGLIRTKVANFPLNKLGNISVQSGFLGNLMGYGTIRIDSATYHYVFRHISNADGFRTNLLQAVEGYETDRLRQSAKEMAMAIKGEQ